MAAGRFTTTVAVLPHTLLRKMMLSWQPAGGDQTSGRHQAEAASAHIDHLQPNWYGRASECTAPSLALAAGLFRLGDRNSVINVDAAL